MNWPVNRNTMLCSYRIFVVYKLCAGASSTSNLSHDPERASPGECGLGKPAAGLVLGRGPCGSFGFH
jgi:hypothetical protein